MAASRKAWLAVLILGLSIAGAATCKKKGGGDENPVAPDPALGPATSVSLCGTTTTEFDQPCAPPPANTIDVNFNTLNQPLACPCFTFTLLNLTQNDLGTAIRNGYGITGLRSGTYQLTGQMKVGNLGLKMTTNTTYSAIGVVPGSVKSLTGPSTVSTFPCSVFYSSSGSALPANFSVEFRVAPTAEAAPCTSASQ